jgi:ferredoxin
MKMERLTYLKDVVTLKLDEAKCTGCGACLEVCPHAVFQMNTRHVEIGIATRAWSAAPAAGIVRPTPFPSSRRRCAGR